VVPSSIRRPLHFPKLKKGDLARVLLMSQERTNDNLSIENIFEVQPELGRDIYNNQFRQTIIMLSLVNKVKVFGNDQDDEFTLVRENGDTNGIFKSWAVPVIPFLEGEMQESLVLYMEQRPESFWEDMPGDLKMCASEWYEKTKDNPNYLRQVLERWRAFSEIHDRRLIEIFSQRDLPTNKEDKISELYWRLKIAFGYAAPFYHLEAMIADSEQTPFNPVPTMKNERKNAGGSLDVIGMTLPSTFSTEVVASPDGWNGLTWHKIQEMTDSLDEVKMSIALNISRVTGTPIEDIIFAANVLERIPVSVGGKKGDLSQTEAIKITEDALGQLKTTDSNVKVAGDMNALIRFLNWFPLVRKEENFSLGKGWRYAAVCDTANELLHELSGGELFVDFFSSNFVNHLLPQIGELDATSAKGRFLLQLIEEGKLLPEIYDLIQKKGPEIIENISIGLANLKIKEATVSLTDVRPRALVGGKAAGLSEAATIFGKENTLPGRTITIEWINKILFQDPELASLIYTIEKVNDLENKFSIAEEIRRRIPALRFTDSISLETYNNYAVRSSSFDEDTTTNGSAAGVYDSVIGVKGNEIESAIRRVVSSFFSEKAISFRALYGLSDKPSMAVIISPYIEGGGGVIITKGNGEDWELSVAESAQRIVIDGGDSGYDSYKSEHGELHTRTDYQVIEEPEAWLIAKLALKAERLLKTPVDMEFVLKERKPVILQLRSTIKTSFSNIDRMESRTEKIKASTIYVQDFTSLREIGKLQSSHMLRVGGKIDIGQFQGELLRFLVANRKYLKGLILERRIPRTSHLVNICANLGIGIDFTD